MQVLSNVWFTLRITTCTLHAIKLHKMMVAGVNDYVHKIQYRWDNLGSHPKVLVFIFLKNFFSDVNSNWREREGMVWNAWSKCYIGDIVKFPWRCEQFTEILGCCLITLISNRWSQPYNTRLSRHLLEINDTNKGEKWHGMQSNISRFSSLSILLPKVINCLDAMKSVFKIYYIKVLHL